MSRHRRSHDYLYLPDFKCNGFTLTPKVNALGIFSVEMPDGELIQCPTVEQARAEARKYLRDQGQQNAPRPSVQCYLKDYDDRPIPASYVGKKKGNDYHCYMFDVGQSNKKQTRKQLSKNEIEDGAVLVPTLDTKKWTRLRDAQLVADGAMELFLKQNKFDPRRADEKQEED